MNFDLSDDQRMLKDSIDRLMAEPGGPQWGDIVELGLTALPFPIARGGLGLGGVETMIVGEAMGRGLVVGPYLAHTVMAGTALDLAGANLADVIAAEKRHAVVRGSIVEGKVSACQGLVPGGGVADWLVVIDGPALAVIATDHPAVSRRSFRLHDGSDAAEITLAPAAADVLTAFEDIAPRVDQAAIAFTAATTLGAAQAAFDLTLDHLRTREQFGRPIGTNQALQHRAVEMLVELEALRSMAIYAALMIDEIDAAERARAFAAIKLVVNKAARFIGQQAVQLHGGIGVAEECAVGNYFRHLAMAERLFGDSDRHLVDLAALGGFVTATSHGADG